MTGTLMGLEHALFAVAGIVGPMFGVAIFQYGEIEAQGITALQGVCGGIFLAVLGVWLLFNKTEAVSKSKKSK